MAEEALNPRFMVVGYLSPSNTGKSFKVIYECRCIGLISRDALLKSLRSRPMLQVNISRFCAFPESKQTGQVALEMQVVDSENNSEEEQP
jgi:hypothetical protein